MEKRYTQRLKAPTTWFLCSASMFLWVGFWLLALGGAFLKGDMKIAGTITTVLIPSIYFWYNFESFFNKDLDYQPSRGALSWFAMGLTLVLPTRFLLPFWAGSLAIKGNDAAWLLIMSLVVFGEFAIRALDSRHQRKLGQA